MGDEQKKRRRRLWPYFVLACVVMCAIGLWHARGYQQYIDEVRQTILDQHAGPWVADLIIVHMKDNNGRWPRNWTDLEGPFDRTPRRASLATFDDLKEHVNVDWHANPAELRKIPLTGEEEPFRVVSAAYPSRANWQGKNPNLMIWEYLQKAQAEPTPRPSGEPARP